MQCLWAPIVVAALTGCTQGPNPPATFPVIGRVVDAGGQVPPGASVQFLPANAEFRALGFVDADGNFSLSVIFDGRKLTGAIEGPHDVTVVYPIDAARDGGRKFTLRKQLVVAPSENQFAITLDKDSVVSERQ
jgi:hypothetical protein